MNTTPFLLSPFVQVCYHVPDVEVSAKEFAEKFGWGPFFVIRHVEVEDVVYRGKPAEFDHSIACGQAGPIMVELVQQHGDAPSTIRDMYSADQFGIQHHATFADNMEEQLKHFDSMGFPTAMRARTSTGTDFAFVDTRPLLGYMMELYPKSGALLGWYDMIRKAAENWDGKDPVRFI